MPTLDLTHRDAELLRLLLDDYNRKLDEDSDTESLSDREHEVLVLLAYGRSYLEIAARCDVTLSTVRSHVANILSKMGARNARHAIFMACQARILTHEDREPIH